MVGALISLTVFALCACGAALLIGAAERRRWRASSPPLPAALAPALGHASLSVSA